MERFDHILNKTECHNRVDLAAISMQSKETLGTYPDENATFDITGRKEAMRNKAMQTATAANGQKR
jgi:hypothetical protein